ncbi:phosphoribosylglycinamide formyltransferase [Tsukamurella sp. 8F]|uniref:phosphoribosylglycinamide formyltransferase n=1 Tax=unclassified Tsukamurella TaxID=2633480 RepID=UPI0023B89D2D|nr:MULTISPECIES: phosphoribosylglycinamide formyltransferase [unclassified Tsukamurella]MDF0532524.1 phosphoribosylglycinamide formyltransferase [Tsukamurella sp. 8J]MDF0589410.1 phosphoribosylglycinamide formyltransferase [Tsukamurella sp. 8F]
MLVVPPCAPARIVVLASGTGSLLASLLEAAGDSGYPGEVVGLVADRDCRAVRIAAEAGLPASVVRLGSHPDRAAWDTALTAAVAGLHPDLVVAAGFMKLLGPEFLGAYGGRVINAHPALLPAFPGARAVPDALEYGVAVTGSTVHLVDSGLDTGPILAQRAVPVELGDTEETLHERIKVVERRLLAEVVADVARRGYTLNGRKVTLR